MKKVPIKNCPKIPQDYHTNYHTNYTSRTSDLCYNLFNVFLVTNSRHNFVFFFLIQSDRFIPMGIWPCILGRFLRHSQGH